MGCSITKNETKKCPTCCSPIERVPQSIWMNAEQWESVKAGDYFCKECPDNGRGASGLCYWFESEIMAAENTLIDAMMRY